MGKLSCFMSITLNGYFEASPGDISWHKHGVEEAEFSAKSLQTGNTLLFGRTTYEQMASFWPTSEAIEHFPVVAEGMNKAKKIVFSKTLRQVKWHNTTLIHHDMVEHVKTLKQEPQDMTLLGSGSMLTQLAEHGLIDEYQIMLDPVAKAAHFLQDSSASWNCDLRIQGNLRVG
jgi:dihydrofolate reductase